MTKTPNVWWAGEIVGALTVDRYGEMGFAYAPEWIADAGKPTLSFSLPKREEPFNRRECRPFFEGLLPEESQRVAVAGALGVSQDNEFKLLTELGGEVAGALTLWLEGETPPAPTALVQNNPLDEAALVKLLDELPVRPFLAGREGLRLSLAGAQSKIPVVLAKGEIALPAPGEATSHILKPPINRFPGTTENEAFAMRLAKKIGLTVADVEIRHAGDRSFCLSSDTIAPATQAAFCAVSIRKIFARRSASRRTENTLPMAARSFEIASICSAAPRRGRRLKF